MSGDKPTNRPTTRQRGDRAERIAVDHLCGLGYRIVDRNFVGKLGEVDIIAWHEDELAFVEVRSRHSPEALNPVYSVNRGKQARIIKAAQIYLSRKFKQTPPARFDVVIVTLDDPPQVEVLRDAFGMEYVGSRGRGSRYW